MKTLHILTKRFVFISSWFLQPWWPLYIEIIEIHFGIFFAHRNIHWKRGFWEKYMEIHGKYNLLGFAKCFFNLNLKFVWSQHLIFCKPIHFFYSVIMHLEKNIKNGQPVSPVRTYFQPSIVPKDRKTRSIISKTQKM